MKSRDKTARKRLGISSRNNQWIGLVFVAPLLFGIVFIFSKLLFTGLSFAFSDVTMKDGISLTFYGLEGFRYALRVDQYFVRYLAEDLQALLSNVLVTLVFSLFVAVILNAKVWGRTAFRAIFFLPVIACTGLISMLDAYNPVMMLMREASTSQEAGFIGALGNPSLILQELEFSPQLITIVNELAGNITRVINSSGVQILIYLAGIQSIPASVFEAAKVEGASAWDCFWKLTLPMSTPFMLVNLVYTFIENLTRDSSRLQSYIEEIAFNNGMYGPAASMAWIHFFCVAIIMMAVFVVIWLVTRSYRKAAMAEVR